VFAKENGHVLGLNSKYGAAAISRLLQIIGLFAKDPHKRDDILQKRPMILRSLLIVTTPYFMQTKLAVF